MHDRLIFLGLLTTPLTTTRADVLITIKGKDLMQHPPPMKGGSNTRNPNKFCFFHHDHKHNTKECQALKKKDRKIDI